jgi:hypothetical protein
MPASPWSHDDLRRLSELAAGAVRLADMARALGRSRRAVSQALRKVLLHQCLTAGADAVADAYGLSAQELCQRLAPPAKYRMPLPAAICDPSQRPAYVPWSVLFFAATVAVMTALGPSVYAANM